MKKPLYLDGATVRDASGRVVISALNPCTMEERREIVAAVNATICPEARSPHRATQAEAPAKCE